MSQGVLPAFSAPLLLAILALGCTSDAPMADEAPSQVTEAPDVETPQAPALPPPALAPDDAVHRLHRGLDVSVHSGTVDWPQVVAEGHGFAILKATEGVDLVDGAFADHWREAAAAGLVRGAYHFYVTEDDPHQQADWFTSQVALQPGDLAPIVDIELIGHGTEDGWQQNVLAFAERLREHYGVTPIVYTSPKFWQTHFLSEHSLSEHSQGEHSQGEHSQGGHAAAFVDFPLWIAEYGVDEPVIPAPWAAWHLWQFRGDAPIAGVEKGADLSRVNPLVDAARLLVPARSARAPEQRTTDARPATPGAG